MIPVFHLDQVRSTIYSVQKSPKHIVLINNRESETRLKVYNKTHRLTYKLKIISQ